MSSLFTSTSVIAILGQRGHGKTTLSRLVQQAFPRVVIIDRLQEYSPDRETRVYSRLESLIDFLDENRTAPRFRAVFQFDVEHGQDSEVFDDLMHVLYYCGNVCVVIEEIHSYQRAGWSPKWLNEAFLTGRHRKMAVIGTSQRAAKVDKTFLSQCSHIFAGKFFLPQDLKHLEDVMGPAAWKLQGLPRGHFLQFQPGEPIRIVKNR